jgi:hypothetical protein
MPDLRALLEAATPGPWEAAGEKRPGVVSHAEYDLFERPFLVAKPTDKRDAALIALAPDLARLVLEAEEAMRGLMEIAETAMPDSYFQGDSRTTAARAFLARSREVTGGGT